MVRTRSNPFWTPLTGTGYHLSFVRWPKDEAAGGYPMHQQSFSAGSIYATKRIKESGLLSPAWRAGMPIRVYRRFGDRSGRALYNFLPLPKLYLTL